MADNKDTQVVVNDVTKTNDVDDDTIPGRSESYVVQQVLLSSCVCACESLRLMVFVLPSGKSSHGCMWTRLHLMTLGVAEVKQLHAIVHRRNRCQSDLERDSGTHALCSLMHSPDRVDALVT